MKTLAELKALHAALLDIVRDAGRCVMEVYATDFEVTDKSDQSPVTLADRKADDLIVARLEALTPDLFIVSEESTEAGRRPADGASFWLVDPLDGTKEFINRNGEFTVNIALIEHGRPVLGVVLRAGARPPVRRRRGRRRLGRGRRRRARHRLPRDAGRGPDRGRQPLARRRRGARRLPRRAQGGQPDQRRLVAQAVPGRRRRGRPLPAPGPHHGMGHRRRPRRAGRRRRPHANSSTAHR
jgi:hypothetical protein